MINAKKRLCQNCKRFHLVTEYLLDDTYCRACVYDLGLIDEPSIVIESKRGRPSSIPDELRPYMKRFYSIRSLASKKDLSFDLTPSFIKDVLARNCRYCGDFPTSLNRLDVSSGYTVDNVVACCAPCGIMKWELSVDEFYSKCQQILDYRSRA